MSGSLSNKRLKKRDYLKILFLFGVVYATIPIIITEIIWDRIAGKIGLSGLPKDIIESFFRAALLEELFKFYGFRCADKRYHFRNAKEYILGAGMVGLAYGIVEKLASGNVIAMILGIVFPMHLLWQMNQGRHFYEYKKAKKNKDTKKAKREFLLATVAIFLLHGCWDAAISLVSYLADNTSIAHSEIIALLLIAAVLLFGVVYTVISIRRNYKAITAETKKE